MTTPVEELAILKERVRIIELDIVESNRIKPDTARARAERSDLEEASTALVAALVRRFDNGTLSGIPTEAARVCLALGFKTARDAVEAEQDKPLLLATNVRGQ